MKMKKSDLKTGMLVKLKNGDVYLVVNDTIIDQSGFVPLSGYDDDLLNARNEADRHLDIVSVSSVLHSASLLPEHWNDETLRANLIWERGKKDKSIDKRIKKRAKKIRKAIETLKGFVVEMQYLKGLGGLCNIAVYDSGEIIFDSDSGEGDDFNLDQSDLLSGLTPLLIEIEKSK